MNDSKIPIRYAKALYDLAREKKLEEKIYNDIIILLDLAQNIEIKEILLSPLYSTSNKFDIIKKIVLDNVEDTTIYFLDLLFKNKRENYLASIARQYIKLYKIKNNIKTIEITTAVDIDENVKEGLKKQVLKDIKARVELVTRINKELVGGFVVQVDDLLYDASVKKQLQKIQQNLVNEKL